MPITVAEAREIVTLFLRDYSGGLCLVYKIRDTLQELYGVNASKVDPGMKGGYRSRRRMVNGKFFLGRVDVPLCNISDSLDMLETLRHEVIGHYGINTFHEHEKRALLDAIITAYKEPLLKELWEEANENYSDKLLCVRAEEVFARYAENDLREHFGDDSVYQRGQQSFKDTCIDRVRLMQYDDLSAIVCMVAQGLHDQSRKQQYFPLNPDGRYR